MPAAKMLEATVVLGSIVAAGLLGGGGTWALWNASVPSGAGTVRAADFRVELNGSPMTMGGTPVTVALETTTTSLTPRSPVHALVTVTNAVDAGGPFTIAVAMGTPVVTQASSAALASALSVQTAPAPASGTCADATYTAAAAEATIAKGESARLCVRASLPLDAPATLGRATATVVLPVTATQQQGA